MTAIALQPRNDMDNVFMSNAMETSNSIHDQDNFSVSSVPSLSEDANETVRKEAEIGTSDEDQNATNNEDETTEIKRSYGGLQNLGNTCYMNSALQVLASLEGFVEKMKSLEFAHNDKVNDKLRVAFLEVMESLAKEETVRPEDFKDAMDERSPLFVGYRQQDSHEFLTTLLDLLDEDYKNANKEDESEAEEMQEEDKTADEMQEDKESSMEEDEEEANEEETEEVEEQEVTETIEDEESYESENKKARKEQSSDAVGNRSNMLRRRSFSELNVEGIEELIHGSTKKTDISKASHNVSAPSGPRCKLVGGRMSMTETLLTPFPENDVSIEEDNNKTPAKVGESDDLSLSQCASAQEDSSPVEEYFKTEVCVSLTCDSCKYTRKHNETYFHLSLEIGTESGSVEDGLRKFFAPEKRELKCEKCFCETAMQTTEITKLPRALLLHFKRFIVDISPDYMSITYRKNQSDVTLEKLLPLRDDFGVLTEFVSQNVSLPRPMCGNLDADDLAYSLRSTVNHIGSSAGCGHYTADANRSYSINNPEWIRFNDSFVSNVSEKEVIADSSQTVYMALYELS